MAQIFPGTYCSSVKGFSLSPEQEAVFIAAAHRKQKIAKDFEDSRLKSFQADVEKKFNLKIPSNAIRFSSSPVRSGKLGVIKFFSIRHKVSSALMKQLDNSLADWDITTSDVYFYDPAASKAYLAKWVLTSVSTSKDGTMTGDAGLLDPAVNVSEIPFAKLPEDIRSAYKK
jgi:hypothetical protein